MTGTKKGISHEKGETSVQQKPIKLLQHSKTFLPCYCKLCVHVKFENQQIYTVYVCQTCTLQVVEL